MTKVRYTKTEKSNVNDIAVNLNNILNKYKNKLNNQKQEDQFFINCIEHKSLALKHLNVMFSTEDGAIDKGYPHKPPFKEPYPDQAFLKTINSTLNLLDALSKKHPGFISTKEKRDIKKTHEYRNKNSTKQIRKKTNENSDFLETKSLIDLLTHPFIIDFISIDKSILEYHGIIIGRLEKSDKNDYYKTMELIVEVLDFLDSVERSVKNNIPDLYHSNRYHYYEHYVTTCENMNLIPSSKELSLYDLIEARGKDQFYMGVSGKTIFADAYFNSPKDFWVHDANHNRRFESYNNLYYKKNEDNLKGKNEKEKRKSMHIRFNDYIKENILPLIEVKSNDSPKDKTNKKIMTILFFELLHEYAFTPDKETIEEAFNFEPNSIAPFEVMVKDNSDKNKSKIEERRLDNFNLDSGIKDYGNETSNKATEIYYFHDRGPNFITSAFNKLSNSFYDNIFETYEEIPSKDEITKENIVKAAMEIVDKLSIKIKLKDKESIKTKFSGYCNIVDKKTSKTALETYPHNNLKKPVLTTQSFENFISPRRKEELEGLIKRNEQKLEGLKTDILNATKPKPIKPQTTKTSAPKSYVEKCFCALLNEKGRSFEI